MFAMPRTSQVIMLFAARAACATSRRRASDPREGDGLAWQTAISGWFCSGGLHRGAWAGPPGGAGAPSGGVAGRAGSLLGDPGQSRAMNRGRGSFPPSLTVKDPRRVAWPGGSCRQAVRHLPWLWAPPRAQGGEATALTGLDTWRCVPRRQWEALAS
ncbi:hypothetical protein NDU88_002729 [Pleurodeles waltl]|uniref:Secreted protein n=1 Tax=Pleurodeles waltl TaxID=8319 RepID=A0AAV7TNF9_PLEWA|nr:hypothetical protein NDU88_002729 [Pleurodeles waltl]